MSTSSALKKRNTSRSLKTGNQRLVTTVVVLAALFLALSIFTFFFTKTKQQQTATNAPTTKETITPQADNPLPDTPTGLNSVVGVVKEISEDRITVRTTVVREGKALERLVLVTIRDDTPFYALGPVPTVLPLGNVVVPERTRTLVDHSELDVGDSIEAVSNDVVDGQPSIVAERIDILS